ncbi:hypothetical protein B0T16DRAFT_453525 [Cercophora newfieldiana]|uniref:Uncharacterized protein n=1 Tax=Cercophora newfieldiana TaxID=92897 RepID=A0AA40CTQ3_9PEZI|nr:hypothetical protein B0T16DRAFT_453525 [Cercophora newfieldiana]
MSADTEALIQAIAFILPSEDDVNRLRDEVSAIVDNSSPIDSYTAVQTAINNLHHGNKLATDLVDRLTLAVDVARLSGNNGALIRAVDERSNVRSLRDFAVNFDTAAISMALAPSSHETPSEATAAEAATIRAAVFNAAPTAAVQGMIMNDKVALSTSDPQVKADVVDVLSKLDISAIGTASVSSLPTVAPEAFAAVPEERKEAITAELKTLSRVATIAPTTGAMRKLVSEGLTTSLSIANVPKANFVSAVASAMTADVASEVHANAVNTVIRNENMLVGLLQLVQGTGLQVIDGRESAAFRKLKFQEFLASTPSRGVNLESLLGSVDQCVCDDCTTVYSAASYFVDLLQYLRETPLSHSDITFDGTVQGQQPSIAGTVLEKFFKRRPDLGNLQLTCENTNTILPYVDLANEVMESFIVNLDSLAMTATDARSKQVKLDVYNVQDEDPKEVLAQPQNTDYGAYQALAAASYPLNLPYHQPIDAQRAFLDFLKVPRLALLESFRHKAPNVDRKLYPNLDETQMTALQTRLITLQDIVLNRQIDAEALSLIQEEYLILTGQVFFPLEYFTATENITLTSAQYQERVGLLPPAAYWGYHSAEEMLSTDERSRSGLQFVKKQFLPRSGISYSDLVSLVKTTFLNPRQPRGRDKTIFNSLRFSYTFLLTLVDNRATDPRRRLGKLAEFLVRTTNVLRLGELLSDQSSGIADTSTSGKKRIRLVDDDEVREWVFTKFESLGKVVVLSSGEGPQLPVEGRVVVETILSDVANRTEVGILSRDGRIKDSQGVTVANVDIGGRVLFGSAANNVTINDQYPGSSIVVEDTHNGFILASVRSGYLRPSETGEPVEWSLTPALGGSCNIDNVRLTHLDGTSLSGEEWSNFHKFIRLWRRLGWSIRDVDMALEGLSPVVVSPPVPGSGTDDGRSYASTAGVPTPLSQLDDHEPITFSSFRNDGSSLSVAGFTAGASISRTNASPGRAPEITPDTIHQLAAIKKLVAITGLPVEQLLTFWTDIPTKGSDKPLYERLFFTSNIRRTDPVFGADINGDYFTGPPCKISDHLLVILAAFRMKAGDVTYLLGSNEGTSGDPFPTPVPDLLSVANLSIIYRHGLIAKVLGVDVPEIGQVLAGGFADPFLNPSSCLDLVLTWEDMEKVGFTWSELRYIADDIPSDLDPLAPSTRKVLQTAKALHDGVVDILKEHTVPGKSEDVTAEMVRAKAALVFEEGVVGDILKLLAGETVYLTRAPTFVPSDTFEAELAAASSKKAVYLYGEKGQSSQLQVTGILTKDETTNVLGLLDPEVQDRTTKVPPTAGSNLKLQRAKAEADAARLYQDWSETVARACRQPRNVFHDSLSGIFPESIAELEMNPETATLLAPDLAEDTATITPPSQKEASAGTQGRTPSQKRRYFLEHFVPFLRDKLARVLILETVISGAGFKEKSVAQTLLENIALNRSHSTETAMDFLLENLKQEDDPEQASWAGYLAPATSDSYIFCVSADSQPAPFILDGKPMFFTLQQEDPQRIWSTTSTPVRLDSGKLHSLSLHGIPPSILQWKPAQGSRTTIPDSMFLPNRAQDQLQTIFTSLQKLAIVTNDFKLSSEEVIHIYNHPEDFENIDFMHMTVSQWKRLELYVEFRDSLPPQTAIPLLDLYKWAVNNPNAPRKDVVDRIAAATTWKPTQISQIMDHFLFPTVAGGAAASTFRNGVSLRNFTQLIAISNQLGVDIPRLFAWASPVGTSPASFLKLRDTADDIKKVARARYDLKTWPDVVKPINDILRENQRQALVSYLLVQDEIKALNITDADGLFEYFLIDTQMTPPVETSRIKQAISTVQVYIQRCLLGLEEPYGVPASALDRQRWNWMSKYRVWEANRKVFLYPENWIDPSLRDNKSEFFRTLESELLQKDLTKQTVSAALKSFLYSVSDVSNMVMIGLCVDYTDPLQTIHLFCRTRTAPYSFYHNKYASGRWSSWSKMAIEVPVYTVEDDNPMGGSMGKSGVYFAPMAFNGRILVFIPQIMKKTQAPSMDNDTFASGEGKTPKPAVALTGWQIQMSWTEYRNGAWTPRKLCPDGVVDMERLIVLEPTPWPTPVDTYHLIPTEVTESGTISSSTPSMIKIFMANAQGIIGEWHFRDEQLSLANGTWGGATNRRALGAGFPLLSFGYMTNGSSIHSLQAFLPPAVGVTDPSKTTFATFGRAPSSTLGDFGTGSTVAVADGVFAPLYHKNIGELMSASMSSTPSGNDTALFETLGRWRDDESLRLHFGSKGIDTNGSFVFDEQSQPFSLYNWELGLHAPMLVIDRLLKAQQFEEALQACHYVFNPLLGSNSNDTTQVWIFEPFKHIRGQTIEAFFQSFQPGVEREDVTAWRNNPFSPHVLARGRPLAYMKWIVMKYIEILIEYGDYYFRQNTLETIPNAVQMYILASHLYGPRGQKVKREGKVKPHTYNSLLNKFDAFSNALVQMEETFPFSNPTPLSVGKLPDDPEVQLANVFGFAGALYFTIPDNPNLRALGEKIDDRLFKIRHSQDIQGIFRQLPLFEPPIDPSLLVQATAQGLSLSSVLSDLNGPMPNYRFLYLLTRAMEMAAEVKSLGQALLSVKEKEQAEAYSVLRASHETAAFGLAMDLKKMALNEANSNLEALQYSRNGPVNRMRYYLQLAGESLSAIPGGDASSEFQELSERLQVPIDQGGLKLLATEKEEMDLSAAAQTVTTVVSALEALSGVFNALPTIGSHATPLGCGAVFNWGPPNVGAATSAIGRGISMGASELTFRSGVAGRKAQALRALNDRLQAANAAGYEISSIDKQIIASKIRVAMAAKEIDAQQKQIDQAKEAEDFLRHKYTNTELYTWLAGETKTVFYATYTAAYDLAKKVEKTFHFERPQMAGTSFIQPGYWNASRDGLLAGERLWCALKRLEASYISSKGHDYEIVKNISLRQIDPLQLLHLREEGVARFAVPEVLFDMDFPGHYLRRVRSVTVTVPCVIGPYASVNATLRLLSSRYRTTTSLENGYRETISPSSPLDPRFASTNVPLTAVAVSTGQSDGGVFELTFSGDRYLPFEGAGAVSEWKLELPPKSLQTFDYGSISDVILTMRYTSLEGGASLRAEAVKSVEDYAKQVSDASDSGSLSALFDVKNEFASAWSQWTSGNSGGNLEMAGLRDRLPMFAVGRAPGSVLAAQVYLLVDGVLPKGEIQVGADGVSGRQLTTALASQDGDFKGMAGYASPAGLALPVENWTLKFPEGAVDVKRMWVLVKYFLK